MAAGPRLGTVLRFLADDDGPTSIEYAFMLTGIALLILTAVFVLGTRLSSLFTTASTHLPSSTP